MLRTRLAKAFLAVLIFGAVLGVSACGGGGGGGGGAASPPPPPPPTSNNPTWTSGVYAASTQFQDRCQVVRTGVDANGVPFPDRAGSTLLENFFLRSWTHETYLFNTEVLDRNPAAFSDVLAYFDVLRTTATTPSGKDKDQFHFSQPTAQVIADQNSTPQPKYGVRYAALSTTVPRDFRILYTEPNSPASTLVNGQANFVRGDRILSVDGVDLINATGQANIDILNNGLFPTTLGETHTFVVQDPGAAGTRNVTLSAANVAPKAVNRSSVINTASGPVGYMLLNTFNIFAAEREISQTITSLNGSGVNDLVLDMRYNGGGLLAISAELGFEIAGGTRTNGRVFERLQFNTGPGGVNPLTGQIEDPTPFYSRALGFSLPNNTALNTLNLPRVYVLATGSTCSASEALINALRGIGVEVNLIGDVTCGKPYGFFPQDNCGETYFSIQFKGVNNAGFGDYADGFAPLNSSDAFAVKTPGCAIADDLNHELGDQNEAMLAAALQLRASGQCPSNIVAQAAARRVFPLNETVAPDGLRIREETPLQVFLENNRDMRRP